ncbi:SusD/RagB family nutrient-binding outer membrane lipoprotein [Flavobacterium cerinum]|uniref:SusD/RagB family nutrient-binding outer membrane lipoprotein n=1 Tax=Flavobacterium cerinum TaxID=2502784 RepID=A0ABY5IVX6_9FLAO|nr:SusD/RagB family nutrient-binding outer membrane lipoprotein [Flavobacterium cerinum]UUC46960.1 SusD/RagB family nutrient-binding outer membrane lipoprotein [Flavobacterium cerinum]
MKKIFYTSILVSLLTVGCISDDSTYNYDKDKSYDVPAENLFTNAQKALVDQMTTPSVNLNPFRFFSQFWAATQYPEESRYDLRTRNVSNNHWNALYRTVLGNLETAKQVIDTEVKPATIPTAQWEIQQKNKKAVIEILQVYTFQILVDSFGDIPYSESLQAAIVLPKYDNDLDIYPALITRLNAAIANLDTSEISFSTGDFIYEGDVTKWKTFANSLKVKLAINLADVNSSLAQSTIQDAFNAGVILNNGDNAKFAYPGAAPMYNPIYANLVASNRNDFVASKTIVDEMNTLGDQRRTVYFELKNGNYIGGINGAANVYQNFSPIGNTLKADNFPSYLMEASEVNFYLAEAAARGYSVGGTADTYYQNAITASFLSWGLSAGDATTYLANPSVNYATASGTYKEKIGRQAWIAFFNRGFEAWTSYRRLDFPNLVAPTNAVTAAEGQVPKRMTYPVNEQTVNNANWVSASAAIGGDKLTSKVFWDVN